jgi:hypothetical protein
MQKNWQAFEKWTSTLIAHAATKSINIKAQYNATRQRETQNPYELDSYLASLEKEMPYREEEERVTDFMVKLLPELRAAITRYKPELPKTRAEAVEQAATQWELMEKPSRKRGSNDYDHQDHKRPRRYENDSPRKDERFQGRDYYRGRRDNRDNRDYRGRYEPRSNSDTGYGGNQRDSQPNPGRGDRGRGRGDHRGGGTRSYPRNPGEKNPLGEDRKPLQCHNCGSEYHFARHCAQDRPRVEEIKEDKSKNSGASK